ncbi:hypothetical protein RclHR1_20520002 [Rhizophagus clarus]|uniref:Uncharacterized protein n=1 Tax=Rhizophagus clarus TaxID=94130 RepID=A0A2Z6QQT5_9GLOM|nr:hypothetical protein RclHR1_20520002 [Rhizophagus clarus]GES76028.1 hypothetical protein RCL_jg20322.t1 [Rhizophagus clarus]
MRRERKTPNYHELFREEATNEDFVHDASPCSTNYGDNSRNKKKKLINPIKATTTGKNEFPPFMDDEEEIPPLDNVLTCNGMK